MVGVLVGLSAVLALAVLAAFSAVCGPNRRVGTWHEAPGDRTLSVSVQRAESAKGQLGRVAGQLGGVAGQLGGVAGQLGRERVGTLTPQDRMLGYATAPRRTVFRYPGASYVKVHFSRLALLPGDHVSVSDAAGTESYRYGAPGVEGAFRLTDRWAMSVTGDTAVVELHRGVGGRRQPASGLGVHVDQVARGFTPAEQAAADAGRRRSGASPGRPDGARTESICGGDQSVDAICYRSANPTAYTRTKAVARLLINGTELCTAWRVGSRNRLLTNNHCLSDSATARRTEVWFNHQCLRCGSPELARATKVLGDRVLATDRVHDYTLFSVAEFTRVQRFGHLLLETRRPRRGQELYLPQHPGGAPARIAGTRAGNCAVVDRAYDGYAVDSDVSYYCDTEGGSSGSPVLSRSSHKVIALHHFGGCPNSGVRADLIHARLKTLI